METIAAISTAMGNGGIGIIRMSGKETFQILSKIFIITNGCKNTFGFLSFIAITMHQITVIKNQMPEKIAASQLIMPIA